MFLNVLLGMIFWGGFVLTSVVLAILNAVMRGNPKDAPELSRLIRILTLVKDGSLHIIVFYLAFFFLVLPLLFVGLGGLFFVLYQFQMIPSALVQEATWDNIVSFALHLWHSQWKNLLYIPMLLIALKQAVKWWKHTSGETVQKSAGVIRTQGYSKSVGIICAIVGTILFLILQFVGSWVSVEMPAESVSESAVEARHLFLGQK